MKSSAALALSVILVALFAAGPAAAAGTTDRIQVTIKGLDNGKSQYKGKITSQSQECVEGRTVKVTSRDSRLVKTKTDSAGKFNAVGKTPVKGLKVTLTVPPKGACPKLVGTATAS